VPTFTSDVAPPTVLTAPGDGIDPSFNLPDTPIPPPRRAPHNFDSLPPKDFEETSPPKSPLNSDTKESLDAIQKFPPKGYSVSPPAHTPSPPNMYRPAPVPRDYPAIQRNISQTEGQNPGPTSMEGKVPLRYNTDDVAVAKAQKHARWAISALNFEDADTAVKELKAALQTLGAL
jgi:vacuolar protein sorting-associated protein VTA1